MARTVGGIVERSRGADCVRLTRTDSVPDGCRVRHFDQLDERTQDVLVGLDAEGTVCDAPGLASGEVVVYTDYYRVE